MKKLNQTLLTLAVIAAVVMLALPTSAVAAQAEDPQLEEGQSDKEPKGLDGWFAVLVDRYERTLLAVSSNGPRLTSPSVSANRNSKKRF